MAKWPPRAQASVRNSNAISRGEIRGVVPSEQ